MMLLRRFFCAAQSRSNREQLCGTVARVNSWLLLEYPGAWRRNAIEGSKLSKNIKAGLQRMMEREPGHRQALIRREHQAPEVVRCFVVRSCESVPRMTQVELSDYEQLIDAELAGLEGHASARAVDGLIYAVCTHGKHDKCCAKFGLPVYQVLQENAGGRVWQCSHIGGDRFAANVVVFPYGIYYGHVSPDEVSAIVRSSARGEVHLENYRGRCCYPRIAQVAEYFVRENSGRMRIDEFRLLSAGPSGVRFQAASDATIHEVVMQPRAEPLFEFLTCGAAERTPVTQYELVTYSVRNGI